MIKIVSNNLLYNVTIKYKGLKYMLNKNILLVIGNGFDLTIGLKNTFKDFFDYYTQGEHCHLIKEKNNAIKSGNINDFFINNFFFIQYQNDKLKSLKKSPNEKGVDWNNFESILENLLFQNDMSQLWKQKLYHGSGYYAQSAINGDCITMLMQSLNYLEDKLKEYIRQEERLLVGKKGFLLQEILEKALFYNHSKRIMVPNINILNFNYTQIETWIENDNKKIKEMNVHGILDNEIIIGIDKKTIDDKIEEIKKSKTQIAIGENKIKDLEKKYVFTKTYRKMELPGLKPNIFSDSIDEIIFYGHSLSSADYSYFQSLFDKCDLYSSKVIIKFCIRKDKNDKPYLSINSIFDLIRKYGDTFTNKDHGRNLLNKLQLENRIKIIHMPHNQY